MARVTLEGVDKTYGRGPRAVHAVQDLTLAIEDGEFVALLGPSGCGKTSTLRMIVGLESITAGEIAFDGRRVNELEPQDRNVAMAFETYALYPSFTVEENLAFPLEVRGVAPAERRKRAREIAEVLRIAEILDEKPSALSGGQQQRVSLGRALVRDPSVFILDEVMSHIDAHLKFQMLFDLKAIHQELGRTMVYVTHDQVEALALADRVAVMSNAVLQQVGTRNELYHRPANVFVADFIGEPPTNFFSARAVEGEGGEGVEGLRLEVPGTELAFVPTRQRAALLRRRSKGEVTLGIRPQNLHLAEGGETGGRPSIEAAVTINEYLGERTILTLEAGAQVFRALVPPGVPAARGDRVVLTYDPGDVMIFDPSTTALID